MVIENRLLGTGSLPLPPASFYLLRLITLTPEPLVDVPVFRNVPEIPTRTIRTWQQFWAYEPEEEELPTF
jgi:hypothetical protein